MNLQVTFLGTSAGKPTADRNQSAVLVERGGESLLFDAGEGVQHRMLEYGTGFDVSTVCLTHQHADHTLGLAGLLQTWQFDGRSRELAVVAPAGSEPYVDALVRAAGGSLPFPVSVETVEPGDVAVERDGFAVRAFAVRHGCDAVGYALVEAERAGRFDRERAAALGVPVGPKFGRLQQGEAVELDDGSVVRPEQVLGPPRPGRTVVYTGDTRPAAGTERVVDAPDLLIHEATFRAEHAERARRTAHSTAAEAAGVASRAGARRLALTHLSPRYGDASGHAAEAAAEFDGRVAVASDGLEIEVAFPS
jgi:ribonuclease Z